MVASLVSKHFKIFGSICHRHIPEERRKKLDDKSEALMLVGYHPTGAYKLYPIQKRTVISRDVVVDETVAWDWPKPEPVGVQIPLDYSYHSQIGGPLQPVEQQQRRSTRQGFPSTGLTDFQVFCSDSFADQDELVHMALLADVEPLDWKQAMQIDKWRAAMHEELNSFHLGTGGSTNSQETYRCEVDFQIESQTRWFHSKAQSQIGGQSISTKRRVGFF